MRSPIEQRRATAASPPGHRPWIHWALVLAVASGCGRDAAPEGEPEPAPIVQQPPRPPAILNAGTDSDGVIKLYPDAPGMRFVLAAADPNAMDQLDIEQGVVAVSEQEGPLSFWSIDTYEFEYTEGNIMGKTARLHIHEPSAEQLYDWQNQKGFLADTESLGDQELTAVVRVRGIFDPEHAAFELKIRGGEHSDSTPPLASCSLMTFATRAAPGVSRFGKELDHPMYDYVSLLPRVPSALEEARWVGLKLVSFVDPVRDDRVVNRLYIDADPIQPDGTLRNDYRLLTEYVDRAGVSTGRYDTLVNWKGYLTTLRIDGVDTLDVARLSARAITAPDESTAAAP